MQNRKTFLIEITEAELVAIIYGLEQSDAIEETEYNRFLIKELEKMQAGKE